MSSFSLFIGCHDRICKLLWLALDSSWLLIRAKRHVIHVFKIKDILFSCSYNHSSHSIHRIHVKFKQHLNLNKIYTTLSFNFLLFGGKIFEFWPGMHFLILIFCFTFRFPFSSQQFYMLNHPATLLSLPWGWSMEPDEYIHMFFWPVA